jgi:antitoxin VapB
MQKAKLFANGRSQAVRLPREFRFQGEAVNIRRSGKAVVLFPADDSWDMLFDALERFTPDFLSGGRNQPQPRDREDPFA